MRDIATCSSCKAKIIWAKSVNGKAMPMDAEPNRDRGTFRLDGDRAIYIKRDDVYDGPRYESHFATCPNSRKHRKKL